MEKHKRNPAVTRALIWTAVLLLLFVFAVLAPRFAPHDPYAVNLRQVTQPPSREYPFGTDYIGRCILSRLLCGAARSIFAAIPVVLITMVVGTAIGIISGYFGGTVDLLIMRFVDTVQAFPSLVFTIAVAAMLGAGMTNCIIAMSVIGWTTYARLARSQVLSLKEKTFVSAAKVSGMSDRWILFHTLLPNSISSVIVEASMHVGNAILSFAGLSFLGLGTMPPFPEWGNMLNDGKDTLQTAPWTVIFPGVAILLVVMIMGMFGDSINAVFNPRKRSDKNQ